MKSFEFEAVDTANNAYKGIVQANNGEEAILKLAQQKIFPKSVYEMSVTQLATANRLLNLKNMKAKLEGNQTKPINKQKLEQKRIDWTYITFTVVIITIIAIYFMVG